MFGLHKTATAQENQAPTRSAYLPAVDVAETESGYTIFADLPGATKDSVDVTLENGVVTLKARAESEASSSTADKTAKVLHREFRRVSYERSFRVGDDVDADQIGAEIENGVLKVTLPRKVAAKKTISVK